MVLSISNRWCARITQAVELKTGRSDGKAGQSYMARVRHRHGAHDVRNPAAFLAVHMLMLAGVAVKALAVAGGFDFADFTLFGKQIKVAVYSAQADARQALTHDSIEFIRSGMRSYFAQFFKYNCTLPRHAQLLAQSISFHC